MEGRKLSLTLKNISADNSAFQKAFQQAAFTRPTKEAKVCWMKDQLRHKTQQKTVLLGAFNMKSVSTFKSEFVQGQPMKNY